MASSSTPRRRRPGPQRRPRASSGVGRLSSSRNRAPAPTASSAWSRVSASTWMVTSGNRARMASIAAAHRPRGDHVVVLDHRDVVQPHALVDAAAAAHRVLLERAQPRGRLAGVEHARARALERVRPAARVGRDARRPRREVEQRPLGDEQHLHGTGQHGQARRRAATRVPSGTRCVDGRDGQPEPRGDLAARPRGSTTRPATTPSCRAPRGPRRRRSPAGSSTASSRRGRAPGPGPRRAPPRRVRVSQAVGVDGWREWVRRDHAACRPLPVSTSAARRLTSVPSGSRVATSRTCQRSSVAG